MRPRSSRKTVRGLGEDEALPNSSGPSSTREAAVDVAPSSRRGIDCPPSQPALHAVASRGSPSQRSTQEFSGPLDLSRGRRHKTGIMPACVEERRPASLVIEQGRAADVFPTRLPQHKGELELAPLNSHDAFVLSLIDGQSSVQSLLDIAAVSEAELAMILDRLVGLGLVTLA